MNWETTDPLPMPDDRIYEWDAVFRMPVPPVEAVAPTTVIMWTTITFASITLVAFIFSPLLLEET